MAVPIVFVPMELMVGRFGRIDAGCSNQVEYLKTDTKHGHKYDWNSHPMAPSGTRAVIYLDPNSRTSWGARGLDAWYCGPVFDHYRCRYAICMCLWHIKRQHR